MGILSLFRPKDESHVIHRKLDHFASAIGKHFSSVKSDIELQKKWVDYLHNLSLKLQAQHHDHKALAENDIKSLKRWVSHLYSAQKKQEDDLIKLHNNISEVIKVFNKSLDAVDSRMKQMELKMDDHKGHIETKVGKIIDDHHSITKERLSSFADELTALKNQPVVQMAPIQSTYDYSFQPLTNPERKLLNLLLSLSDPIGYAKIADMTGNSINTVRVVMNSLKKKDVIEENTLPSGEKLFAAKNKEKIKKIYNVAHI